MTVRKSARSVAVPVTSPEQSLRRAAGRAAVELLERRQLLSSVVVNSLLDNVNDSNIGGSSVTLREAVKYLDAHGGGTVTFDPSLTATGSATITLTTVGDSTAGPSALGIPPSAEGWVPRRCAHGDVTPIGRSSR